MAPTPAGGAGTSPPGPEVDVVLFDLGGVLMDFGGVGRMKRLAGIDTDDALWERWLSCRWVRAFERGHCSGEDFAVGIVDDWDLAIDPDEFLRVFSAWPVGPLDGAAELVGETSSVTRVGCLSNTNAVHWSRHAFSWPILDAFEFRFLSFELGMVKPDGELFDHVASALPVGPERVLFLDDNAVNVSAASRAGFRAAAARGVDGARRALVGAGLLGA